MRRVLVLGIVGLMLLAACAPERAVPTLLAIITPTGTPVSTLVPPSETPFVLTRPPLLPSATSPATQVPTLTPSATPLALYVESLTSERPDVVMALYPACQPQTTTIRAIIRSLSPLSVVSLNWTYADRFATHPAIPMRQIARGDWVADLGPFMYAGTARYWVVARDSDGNQTLSDEAMLEVLNCEEPPPTLTLPPGPRPTATPPYGEALSVRGVQQDVSVPYNTPTTIILRWEGGVEPVTIDRVTQPEHGTLSGMGAGYVYTPNGGYIGEDSFTFRVLDANDQASTGVIRLTVQGPR